MAYNEYVCPVCNGLEPLIAACPQCRSAAEDCGRTTDYYGPYSPYRPIDDLKLTNGFMDASANQCIHTSYCPACQSVFNVAVQEAVL